MDKVNPLVDSLIDFWDNHTTFSYASIVTLTILVGGHLYYKSVYSYWEKKGLKNPKPSPIIGNSADLLFKYRMPTEKERRDKYGKVYGIYFGTKRQLVIADPEVLRQICIKDFDKFPDHGQQYLNDFQQKVIINLQGDHWKRVRSMLSPTFTSGKIKRMYKMLNACADDLVKCCGEKISEGNAVVDLKDLYSLYTMDGITTCCYEMKLERKGSTDLKSAASRDEFVALCMSLFKINALRFAMAFLIPKFILKPLGFVTVPLSETEPLISRVNNIIKGRLGSGKKFDDYLQILLEARFNEDLNLDENDNKENHHAGLTTESMLEVQKKLVDDVAKSTPPATYTKIQLSPEEIVANASFLLLVGLETTATLLTYCTHTLAFNKEVQERLHDEIEALAEYSEDKGSFTFDYEALTSCQYLDAVISESMRILTPVIQMDRMCAEDYYIEKYNLTVEKGTTLILAYYAIMTDPEYWPNPDKFDPDRFMPENRDKIVPGSYCPFGLGPRHCLGMRFSLTEAKLGLAKIVMNYRFEPAPGTEWPLKSGFHVVLNPPKNPIVKVVKRNLNR